MIDDKIFVDPVSEVRSYCRDLDRLSAATLGAVSAGTSYA